MGDLDAHGDALLLLGLGLLGEELVEEVEVGRLATSRGREDAVEPLRDGAEAKLKEPFLDASTHEFAHEAPPIASAYTSRLRASGELATSVSSSRRR